MTKITLSDGREFRITSNERGTNYSLNPTRTPKTSKTTSSYSFGEKVGVYVLSATYITLLALGAYAAIDVAFKSKDFFRGESSQTSNLEKTLNN